MSREREKRVRKGSLAPSQHSLSRSLYQYYASLGRVSMFSVGDEGLRRVRGDQGAIFAGGGPLPRGLALWRGCRMGWGWEEVKEGRWEGGVRGGRIDFSKRSSE